MTLRLYLYEKSPNELKADCRFHKAFLDTEQTLEDDDLNSESSDGEGN